MAIIMLAGPIKAWWDENWNTPEHWHYALWRERVGTEMVKSYHLVYRPHEAFQGSWDERAQSINDFILRTADVIFNLTPPGVLSEGTDGEVLYARNFGKTIIDAPPPERVEDFERALIELNMKLTELGLSTTGVKQVGIVDSLDVSNIPPERYDVVRAWVELNRGEWLRYHYTAYDHTIAVFDTQNPEDAPSLDAVLKIEVLAGPPIT